MGCLSRRGLAVYAGVCSLIFLTAPPVFYLKYEAYWLTFFACCVVVTTAFHSWQMCLSFRGRVNWYQSNEQTWRFFAFVTMVLFGAMCYWWTLAVINKASWLDLNGEWLIGMWAFIILGKWTGQVAAIAYKERRKFLKGELPCVEGASFDNDAADSIASSDDAHTQVLVQSETPYVPIADV